jgi:hypothetical protein
MTNGKRTIPAYEEGMQPPDGSGEWRFGNLRFDWGERTHACAARLV